MQIFSRLLASFVLLNTLGGCATWNGDATSSESGPASAALAFTNPADLVRLDRLIQELSRGAVFEATLPGAERSVEMKLERRYFSASGKHCAQIAEIGNGGRHIICRSREDELNLVSPPEAGML